MKTPPSARKSRDSASRLPASRSHPVSSGGPGAGARNGGSGEYTCLTDSPCLFGSGRDTDIKPLRPAPSGLTTRTAARRTRSKLFIFWRGVLFENQNATVSYCLTRVAVFFAIPPSTPPVFVLRIATRCVTLFLMKNLHVLRAQTLLKRVFALQRLVLQRRCLAQTAFCQRKAFVCHLLGKTLVKIGNRSFGRGMSLLNDKGIAEQTHNYGKEHERRPALRGRSPLFLLSRQKARGVVGQLYGCPPRPPTR